MVDRPSREVTQGQPTARGGAAGARGVQAPPLVGVGSQLGEYEIVAPLRVGGMAALFLGRRHGAAGFAKFVAIKVVHPHLARDPQFGRMFVDEALISARIEHPNVVHVMELGEQDGAYYLVMEYVHGVSLSQLLGALAKRGRRLSPELAVYIAVRVAEGLQAAHETLGDDEELLGIVHRDISPQNVLLSARGHVKLIDFGIAKARGRLQQTATSSLKGKIRYMSPEQAYGRPVDARTDVYALAVVLWEMLAMRRMFSAENDFALLEVVRHPSPSPPSAYLESCSPALDAAVMHALVPVLDGRTSTAQELRRELAAALPSALALDSSNLGDLLGAVMADELEEGRKTIAAVAPAGAGFEVVAPRPTRPESIENFTVSDGRIALLPPDESVLHEESAAPISIITMAAPSRTGSAATPIMTPVSVASPSPAAPARSRVQLWVGVAAVLALVGVGIAGYVALDRARSVSDASTPAPAGSPATTASTATDAGLTPVALGRPAELAVVVVDGGATAEGLSDRAGAGETTPIKQTKVRNRRLRADDGRIGANGSAIMR